MIDKLKSLYNRWLEIGEQLNDSTIIADMKRYIKLSKDYKELQPIADAYKKYSNIIDNLVSSKEILYNEKDEEFRNMAKAEFDLLTSEKEKLDEEIRVLLIPADPTDDKNAVMEIRAGTGGDEASIFAGDLYRMYTRFCERKNGK